jgi:hypothetical protein
MNTLIHNAILYILGIIIIVTHRLRLAIGTIEQFLVIALVYIPYYLAVLVSSKCHQKGCQAATHRLISATPLLSHKFSIDKLNLLIFNLGPQLYEGQLKDLLFTVGIEEYLIERFIEIPLRCLIKPTLYSLVPALQMHNNLGVGVTFLSISKKQNHFSLSSV